MLTWMYFKPFYQSVFERIVESNNIHPKPAAHLTRKRRNAEIKKQNGYRLP